MSEGVSSTKRSIPGWVKRVVPMLVSALILCYYFYDQDWIALKDAAGRANIPLAVAAVLIPQLIYWFFEVLIAERHFRWYHEPFPWRDYIWARGAMYLLMLVNNSLAGGGILVYLKRKTVISWKKMLGIILFRVGLTMWGIGLVLIPATIMMHRYGLFEKAKLNVYVWWGVLIFGVVWMTEAWIVWHHGRNFGLSKIVVRDRNSEFWTAFSKSTPRQWLYTFFMGLAPLFILLWGFWFLALAFGVKLPLLHYLVVSPIAMLIVEIPIAFAGFGTTTIAWMFFFGEYGDREAIVSISLFLPFLRAMVRACIGLVCLKPALKDLNTLIAESKVEMEIPVPEPLGVEEAE